MIISQVAKCMNFYEDAVMENVLWLHISVGKRLPQPNFDQTGRSSRRSVCIRSPKKGRALDSDGEIHVLVLLWFYFFLVRVWTAVRVRELRTRYS